MKSAKTISRIFLTVFSTGLIVGGANSAFAQGGSWATKAPMPTPRVSLGVGVVAGKLYAVGGNQSSGYPVNGTTEAYDPITDTWTTNAPMPTARGRLGVAAVNGIVYAMGGCGDNACGNLLSTLEAYDPVSNTWVSKAPMPTARRDFMVAVINGIIYVVGGLQGPGSSGIQSVEAYDPATDTWSIKAPMPTARGNVFGGVLNGLLYACGGTTGYGGSSQVFATVEVYDPVLNAWTSRADMPLQLAGLGAGVVDGILYATGNGGDPSVWAYDPLTDSWSLKTPRPSNGGGLAVGVVDGILFAVGGSSAGVAIGVNEAFTPPPGLTLAMYAGLTIKAPVGSTNQIQYVTNLSDTNNWVTLTNLVLPSNPYIFIDYGSPGQPRRFYRDTLLP